VTAVPAWSMGSILSAAPAIYYIGLSSTTMIGYIIGMQNYRIRWKNAK